jgi:hypothetical protein
MKPLTMCDLNALLQVNVQVVHGVLKEVLDR